LLLFETMQQVFWARGPRNRRN